MGIVAVAFLGCAYFCPTGRNDDVDLEPHQLGREREASIEFSFTRSLLNDDVFPLDVPELAQALLKCLDAVRVRSKGRNQLRYPIRGTFVGCCASSGTS